jgi:hypothetical protein
MRRPVVPLLLADALQMLVQNLHVLLFQLSEIYRPPILIRGVW